MDSWPPRLLGWPTAFLGRFLLMVGVTTRIAFIAALGALLATGFCGSVAMIPGIFRRLGLPALAGNDGAAWAVYRETRRLLAVALVPPLVLATGVIGSALRAP